MALERPVSFDDAARGVSLTAQPGPPARLDLGFRTADGVQISAHVPVDAAAFEDLAAVMAAPGAAHLDDQRLRFGNLARRASLAMPTAANALRAVAQWLLRSREDTNYTYDLTPANKLYLAHLIAVVTARPVAEIKNYIAEVETDAQLRDHFGRAHDAQDPAARAVSDRTARYSRRIGWYALVRALKPRLVIETGVDKGLGSVVLCAALLRNRAEGAEGRYMGTDIRPEAGALLTAPYNEVGRIAYGDSIATLQTVADPIDLFINDSDHSAEYEAREYETIAPRLSDRSVILGDNAHVTERLAAFAEATGRRFVFFKEQPADHFYLGAGIGIAFR